MGGHHTSVTVPEERTRASTLAAPPVIEMPRVNAPTQSAPRREISNRSPQPPISRPQFSRPAPQIPASLPPRPPNTPATTPLQPKEPDIQIKLTRAVAPTSGQSVTVRQADMRRGGDLNRHARPERITIELPVDQEKARVELFTILTEAYEAESGYEPKARSDVDGKLIKRNWQMQVITNICCELGITPTSRALNDVNQRNGLVAEARKRFSYLFEGHQTDKPQAPQFLAFQ